MLHVKETRWESCQSLTSWNQRIRSSTAAITWANGRCNEISVSNIFFESFFFFFFSFRCKRTNNSVLYNSHILLLRDLNRRRIEWTEGKKWWNERNIWMMDSDNAIEDVTRQQQKCCLTKAHRFNFQYFFKKSFSLFHTHTRKPSEMHCIRVRCTRQTNGNFGFLHHLFG